MSELPEVRRADCGHGFLLMDVPPAAVMENGQHPRLVYLCEDCRASLHRPAIERKDVRLAGRHPGEIMLQGESVDWADRGGQAARAGEQRTLPEELRGKHPRSAEPRAWFAGYDEAKAAEVPSEG